MRKSKMLAIALFSVIAFIIAGCDLQSILSELNEEDDSKSTSNTVTITYVTELGNVPSPFTNTKNKGDQLKRADLPELEHEGYIFEGWYYQGDLVRAGNFRVYADLTLTAKWTKAATQPEPEPEEENDSGYIGTKAPGELKEEGDIVFTDGSAIPYKEGMILSKKQKASAVAIIVYSPFSINSHSYNVKRHQFDRILGIGFEYGYLEWCLDSANAFGFETYIDNNSGEDNFKELGSRLSAEGSKTEDDTDNEEKYPAFYFCKNYKDTATNLQGTDYETGWYLPSSNEFDCVSDFGIENLSQIFEIFGYEDLYNKNWERTSYWTSNDSGDYYAEGFTYSTSGKTCNKGTEEKKYENRVYAFRTFSYKIEYDPEHYAYGVSSSLPEGTDCIISENSILTSEQLPELSMSYAYTFEGWYDGETKVEPGKYKVTKDVTLVAKWKQNEYIGTKAPSEPKEVGDFVFIDGSSAPSSIPCPISLDYIAAIIYYKGSSLNSGDDTTVRTLGVGRYAMEPCLWCTADANCINVDIPSIICTYTNSGSFEGDKNGSDNFEQIKLALGENDDTDDEEKYPAFYKVINYKDTAENLKGTDYESGWYLPSLAELDELLYSGTILNHVVIQGRYPKFATSSLERKAMTYHAGRYSNSYEVNCETISSSSYYEFAIREF